MKLIFILFVFLLSVNLKAQDSLIYDEDYVFKDGVFRTFNEFKENSPSFVKENIKANFHSFAQNYEKFLVRNIQLKDSINNVYQLDSLWGYSYNGIVYIYYKNQLNRIRVFGSIAHFLVTKEVRNYSSTNYPNYISNNKDSQYFLDFSTGNIYKYNLENFSLILKRDTMLYNEFSLNSDRKKAKLMFIYLRKYNERNPIYFKSS